MPAAPHRAGKCFRAVPLAPATRSREVNLYGRGDRTRVYPPGAPTVPVTDAITDDLESAFDEFDGELPETVDEAAIRRMQAVALILDDGVRVPGTNFRIGIDPIVGVVPGAGDTVAAAVSLYIVLESARLGVSHTTLVRMLGNIAVDTAGGSVPVLGVLFDAVWKANRRNLKLALRDLTAATDARQGRDSTTVEVE